MQNKNSTSITDSFLVDFIDGQAPKITLSKKPIAYNTEDKFFWRHMDYQNPEAKKILTKHYGISSDVAEALCDISTRPRYFHHKKGIVLILRGINYNPNAAMEDMVSLRVWVEQNKIITLSHNSLKAVSDLRELISSAEGLPTSPMQLFLLLAQNMSDSINDTIIDMLDETADVEEKILDADSLSDLNLRDKISNMRRDIIAIRRYAAPQREIFIQLQNDKWDALTEEDREDIREIYNDITKAVEDLDYCREQMSVFSEEMQSKVSISMTRIMYTISLVTVIFTPLTMLTGLLGMNVEGIPYAEKPYAFATVCAVMLILCGMLVFLMKRLKWL